MRISRAGLLLVLLAAGCGSSHSSSVSVAQACADLAMARCNLRSLCSLPDGFTGLGASVLENYGDLPTCLAREALACENGLSAPQTGNTPQAVESCVARFSSFSCMDFFDDLPPADCTPLGPRADGAACTFNAQCQSGYCNGTKGAVCGTCGPPPAEGDDCSTSACLRGDRCLGATSTCAAVVSSNGTCDESHPCDRGLTCVGSSANTMTAGTCQTAGTRAGVACGGSLPGCDGTRSLSCRGPNGAKTCAPVSFSGTVSGPDGGLTASDAGAAAGASPAGSPCGQLPDGARVGCVAGGCYTDTGPAGSADLGTCKPFAPDGDACDSAAGPGCMPPARCVTGGDSTAGTCVVPQASLCPGG